MDGQTQKMNRLTAVEVAVRTWDEAPGHVRAMAGAYVTPLIEAVRAISQDMDNTSKKVEIVEHKLLQMKMEIETNSDPNWQEKFDALCKQRPTKKDWERGAL